MSLTSQFFRLFLKTGSALFIILPVFDTHAAEIKWKTIAGWSIYFQSKGAPICYVSRRYEDSTYLQFGIGRKSETFSIFVSSNEMSAQSLGENEEFVFRFETGMEWVIPMSLGVADTGELSFSYSGNEADLLSDIAEQNRLMINVDGRTVADLSLDNSYQAMLELIECQRSMIADQ